MTSPQNRPAGFLLVLGFAFAVEGALYSAVTPILPLLSRTLDMSDSQAGLMLSAYSAGIVAGSLLCVPLLRYIDVRAGAVAALVLLSVSTLAFAWAQRYGVVVSFRLVQGLAGGATWTTCVTWLLRMWPLDKRGEALGMSVGPAVIGTIAGPAIGTAAVQLGIHGPYTTIAVLCLGAAIWLLWMPRPPRRGDFETSQSTVPGQRRTHAVLGAIAIAVAGVLLGLTNLAAPLVLVVLGAPEWAIGVVFVVAAVATVVAARFFGSLVDTRGATRMLAGAMLLIAIALPPFGAALDTYLTVGLVIILLLANNVCYLSAGTLLSRDGERSGWSLSFVTAMTGTVWGLGETAGAFLGGLGLDHVGAFATSVMGAALAATTLACVVVIASRGHSRRSDGESECRPVDVVRP